MNKIPLTFKDLEPGKWLYLDEKAAKYVEQIYDGLYPNKTNKVIGGDYNIAGVDTSFVNPPASSRDSRVAAEIIIVHRDWDFTDINSIPVTLVINEDMNIILAGALLIRDALFRVESDMTIEYLIEENNKRGHGDACVGCGRPLTVISINMNICNYCEAFK